MRGAFNPFEKLNELFHTLGGKEESKGKKRREKSRREIKRKRDRPTDFMKLFL